MKKTLLLALMATAASLTLAEQKTVTFNLTTPSAYGYVTPTADKTDSPLSVGDKITTDDVDFYVISNGNTPCRFWYTANGIQLRMTSGCSMGITANGQPIKSVTLAGNNINPASNFTSNVTSWTYNSTDKVASWNGTSDVVEITQANSTMQMTSLTVVYGEDNTQGGGGEQLETESFTAIDATGIHEVFANATSDGARSIVSFGTANMDVEAVGGRTPKDTKLGKDQTFTDWCGWNEPSWQAKSQNLCDRKPGVDTVFFYYINGTGNPGVAITVDENPVEKDDSLIYKPKYTYYEPDGSLGMPISGLYYRFSPKVSGMLKVQVWSNKGNRNTFFVKESTKLPVKYGYEGYINGMDETHENVVMKDVNGNDSIGLMNYKRFLTQEVIDSIHHAMKTTYIYDTIWNETHTEPVELIKKDSIDNAPYVIAGGNQNFWGWVTLDVEAGESYWLFQHSSQIGFSGYEFTPGASAGIETLETAQTPSASHIFDITGKKVAVMQRGNLYLKNGKKIIIR